MAAEGWEKEQNRGRDAPARFGDALRVRFFRLPMTSPIYVTTDFYLAAFLCHKGATFTGLRRLGPKKVEFSFVTGEQLHHLLRLYWSGQVAPVIPWELFMAYRHLKNTSINKYE